MKLVTPFQRDLKQSAIVTGVAKDAGLTWGAFKCAMAELGVRDGDRVASIEYGVKYGTGHIVREDADDGIEVREI